MNITEESKLVKDIADMVDNNGKCPSAKIFLQILQTVVAND